DVDLVIIRRDGVDLTHHVDYVVRRDKVRRALEYKIAHDDAYRDLQIDQDALSQLPENGTVVNRIPTCREGRQDEGPAGPAGPNQAAGTDGDDESTTFVGGVPNLGNTTRPEVEEIRRAAGQAAGPTYQQTIIQAPAVDPNPVAEWTPGYMALAFPSLFPDGTADFYSPRQRKIDLGEYFAHLMRYQGGRFARHRRFPWFAFNTLQRQR
ncbi:hypothetical protein C8F01DRAFT_968469, partial [Mycena amicta]